MFEVWVFGPGDYREVVGDCGVGPADAAQRRATALWTWLHFAIWSPEVLPRELLEYRDYLSDLGVNPQQCEVACRPVGGGDNAARAFVGEVADPLASLASAG